MSASQVWQQTECFISGQNKKSEDIPQGSADQLDIDTVMNASESQIRTITVFAY